MIPLPIPKTPQRTPNGISKTVQLTPVWEEVVKNNRIPPEVNLGLVFQEISSRLEDAEGPVRQHAFRVLSDVIPVLDKGYLDEKVVETAILEKLVMNLGHPAPGVRKVALETLQQYLKHTIHAERMLDKVVEFGVRDQHEFSAKHFEISRENVTLGTIVCLADIMKPFVFPENGGYVVSPQCLNRVVDALCMRLMQTQYEDKAVECLEKIRHMVGEGRFHRAMAYLSIPPTPVMHLLSTHSARSPDSINLEDSGIDLKLNSSSPQECDPAWRDHSLSDDNSEKTQNDSELELGQPLDNSLTTYHNTAKNTNWNIMEKVQDLGESSEASEGTDTDTYTKEAFPEAIKNEEPTSPSFIAVDEVAEPKQETLEVVDKCEKPQSPFRKVVLETEIKFSTEKAITMTIMEDEGNTADDENEIDLFQKAADNAESAGEKRYVTESGELVMKVLHDAERDKYEDEDERKRTPRRVRFGGEVIKLRTPDSDTTVEVHEPRPGTSHGGDDKKPQDNPKPKVDRLVLPEPSHIPLPVAPATVSPQVKFDRMRDTRKTKPVIDTNGEGSLNSSSGSESELKLKLSEAEEEERLWKWTEWKLVDETCLAELKDKTDWKTQFHSLEQLKLTLAHPKALEVITRTNEQPLLDSLLRWLLFKMADSGFQQVATLAVSMVAMLLQSLPRETLKDVVEDVVVGLCRHVGGCRNVNLKIEAVQALKTLFGVVGPKSVIDVLNGDRCLGSNSSKMRENSLLAIMYATMTFPSNLFDIGQILSRVANVAADSRRRVRHAALEAIAVLSQFCTSGALATAMSGAASSLAGVDDRAALIAAVQVRLSRRTLPTVSHEGLVLYALQIPASRRIGKAGNPAGADVDWILSGFGSVSTGSARSRCQLNAAQRLDGSPNTFTPTKWRSNENLRPSENPWTIQKQRTESNIYKTKSTNNLQLPSPPAFNPEQVTWALVPVSALDEQLSRRSSNLWSEFGSDTQLFTTSQGSVRPLYLKLQPELDDGYTRVVTTSKGSNHYAKHRPTENIAEGNVRVLTPSMLREKASMAEDVARTKRLDNGVKSQSRQKRSARLADWGSSDNLRKPFDYDDRTSVSVQRSILSSHSNSNHLTTPPAAVFLPSIHTRSSYPEERQIKQQAGLNEIDEIKLQDTVTQLSGLLTASKSLSKSLPSSDSHHFRAAKNHFVESEIITPIQNGHDKIPRNEVFSNGDPQPKLFESRHRKAGMDGSVASAPAVITSAHDRSSTSSSDTIDMKVQRLNTNPSPLEVTTNLSYQSLNSSYNQKVKAKRAQLLAKKTNILQNGCSANGNHFPDTLKPFDRPKEGLDTCFNQLESQQWEVNMLGLTSLVRLLRHHPTLVLGQLHNVVVALGRQIKNLRSQVARAACQAAGEMFTTLKKHLETDLDELVVPLFHRAADTNKFIRGDCNKALNDMTDSLSPARVAYAIITKGTTHQNAIVRTASARLLLRLTEAHGPAKMLSLPKEIRDKMILAGANLLTEGKQETRSFAKQLFRAWSIHPSFPSLIEAIPPNVMRLISKTLTTLKNT